MKISEKLGVQAKCQDKLLCVFYLEKLIRMYKKRSKGKKLLYSFHDCLTIYTWGKEARKPVLRVTHAFSDLWRLLVNSEHCAWPHNQLLFCFHKDSNLWTLEFKCIGSSPNNVIKLGRCLQHNHDNSFPFLLRWIAAVFHTHHLYHWVRTHRVKTWSSFALGYNIKRSGIDLCPRFA